MKRLLAVLLWAAGAICASADLPIEAGDQEDGNLVPGWSVGASATIEGQAHWGEVMVTVGRCSIGRTASFVAEVDAGYWYVLNTVDGPGLRHRISEFSSPLWPMYPWPPDTLDPFDPAAKLFRWERYLKAWIAFRPPMVVWDLETNQGYRAFPQENVQVTPYSGYCPFLPYKFRMGPKGWAAIGIPRLRELGYPDFMPNVVVEYPSGSGSFRTAHEDRTAPDPWLNWGWSFWDNVAQSFRTFTPYSPFGNNVCRPGVGYWAYANVGTAQSEADPDQVTLIWPAYP